MARKIIILDRTDIPSDLNFNVAFWADVPVARQSFYANPTATSQVKNATAGELSAIQGGTIKEQVKKFNFPANTPIATIQAALIAEFNTFQTYINSYNPWVRYGTYWDGTSWTSVTTS